MTARSVLSQVTLDDRETIEHTSISIFIVSREPAGKQASYSQSCMGKAGYRVN